MTGVRRDIFYAGRSHVFFYFSGIGNKTLPEGSDIKLERFTDFWSLSPRKVDFEKESAINSDIYKSKTNSAQVPLRMRHLSNIKSALGKDKRRYRKSF